MESRQHDREKIVDADFDCRGIPDDAADQLSVGNGKSHQLCGDRQRSDAESGKA